MKVLTWNCGGAFRRKFQYVEQFDADVLVIQECENPETIKCPTGRFLDFSDGALWTGDSRGHKGLGVFKKRGVVIERLEFNHLHKGRQLQWFIPFRVNGHQNMIAVWTHHANAKAFPYIGQFYLFFKNNEVNINDIIICGDFNSNSYPEWESWDRHWNHSDCVKLLEKKGISSVYHAAKDEQFAKETENTFFHRSLKREYHIDYIFSPKSYILQTKKLTLGSIAEWKDKSDHVPILWEFEGL